MIDILIVSLIINEMERTIFNFGIETLSREEIIKRMILPDVSTYMETGRSRIQYGPVSTVIFTLNDVSLSSLPFVKLRVAFGFPSGAAPYFAIISSFCAISSTLV